MLVNSFVNMHVVNSRMLIICTCMSVLVSIVVTCMSYQLGKVDFIFKDEREMLMYYCMRCEILVVYANNREVSVHSYV